MYVYALSIFIVHSSLYKIIIVLFLSSPKLLNSFVINFVLLVRTKRYVAVLNFILICPTQPLLFLKLESLNVSDHSEDVGVDGRIILK
jgi:hypothetical protein